jgi:hypothetical protein
MTRVIKGETGLKQYTMRSRHFLQDRREEVSWSSEFVYLNRVVGSPSQATHTGYANSLDGHREAGLWVTSWLP